MMGTRGSFGYKIGRKVRLMQVDYDADLLWQILVREIYVLMKHYGSIETLRERFEQLIDAKNKPSKDAIEKCEMFTSVKATAQSKTDWNCLTRYCQHSFINILESGYFLNNGSHDGLIFLLDFNTNSVKFYTKNLDKKEMEYEKATIEEIMEFDDMPTKSYTEIITKTIERFKIYNEKLEKINTEIEKINNIIKKARELGGDQNILSKAKELLNDMEWEKKKLELDYRFFYHRLNALNLIDHNK